MKKQKVCQLSYGEKFITPDHSGVYMVIGFLPMGWEGDLEVARKTPTVNTHNGVFKLFPNDLEVEVI